MEGEQARLIVDARDADGGFLNGLTLRSSLVAPDRSATTLALQQVAPGRYETTFDPTSEGAYMLVVNDSELSIKQTVGWVMSYSPEYRPQGASILPDIATLGGRSLVDDPGAAFTHDLAAQAALTPIAPLLLLLALLLLPFDVAVRRLLLTRSDLARARSALLRGAEAAREPSERLSTLMGAKARARATTTSEQPAVVPDIPASPPVSGDQPRFTRPAAPVQQPAVAPKTEAESNIAGQLLKRRKEREK